MYFPTLTSASQSASLGSDVFVHKMLMAKAVVCFVLRMYSSRPMPCLYLS